MPKPVRLSDIADLLEVSTVTVSNALSGKKGMSEQLREKIRDASEQLGYTPCIKEKQEETVGNIGILVQSKYCKDTISFYWDLYRRILIFLREEHCMGVLEILTPEDEKNRFLPRLLREKKAGGVIVIGELDQDYRRHLTSYSEKEGTPLVLLDSDDGEMENTCVISDGYYGMYRVTRYLIKMGHREIMYVGSIHATSSILDRYYGYCRAMTETGLTAYSPMPDRDENGMIKLLLPETLPTAFVCNSDFTAVNLTASLRERGLSVPEDISIASFDDFLYPGYHQVGLTTWAVDMDGMAKASVDIVTGKLKLDGPRTMLICGRLMIRESVRQLLSGKP